MLYTFDNLDLTHLTAVRDPTKHVVALTTVPSQKSCTFEKWHQRLGHANARIVSSVLKTCNIPVSNKNFPFCNGCCYGKSHKLPFPTSLTVYIKPFELIYTDLWGPTPTHSTGGYTYYITFIDAFSRLTWIFFLKRKSEALSIFEKFKTMAELQLETRIKVVQSDWGESTNLSLLCYRSMALCIGSFVLIPMNIMVS